MQKRSYPMLKLDLAVMMRVNLLGIDLLEIKELLILGSD